MLIGLTDSSMSFDRFDTTADVIVRVEYFVQDLGIASFELDLIDGCLFVFRFDEDGKTLVLTAKNFTIINKEIYKNV